MISRYTWYLRILFRQVWLRVASFALLALLSVWVARGVSAYLPEDIALETGSEAVGHLLNVLTSSMLAVTTFSLSIAVSAFATASSNATPRAAVLLQQDHTTQNVLATFLGAFVFGLVGLIALNANLYDDSGRLVIFAVTVVVIGLVVLALIRWIDHLMTFGFIGNTLDRVEAATSDALQTRLHHPYLGGVKLTGLPADATRTIDSRATGYVQHIDMQALQDCADVIGAPVYLSCLPGTFITVGEPLLRTSARNLDEEQVDSLCTAVTLGKRRTFDGDPRFGLIVLSEIASRALSPAVNDPGTAIDILGRLVRLLALWRDEREPKTEFPKVHVQAITAQEMIEDAFRPIARDAAGLVEVQIRLQKALLSISQVCPDTLAEAATAMAQDAVRRAEASGLVSADMQAIRAAAARINAAI